MSRSRNGETGAEPDSFDRIWHELCDLADRGWRLRTRRGSTCRLTLSPDGLAIESKGHTARPYSRDAVRRLWQLRETLADPRNLTVADIERRWDMGGDGSHLWALHPEMWRLAGPPFLIEQARELRRGLARALTGVANGAGDLPSLLHQIERVVKSIAPQDPDRTMADGDQLMWWYVRRRAPSRLADTGLPGMCFSRLYTRVRRARNDVAHTGTEAALASMWTAALATVLMEALTVDASEHGILRICEVMVSNPTRAYHWQTLADVRRTMLVNDYSVLPLDAGGTGGGWRCVGAEQLARYRLHSGTKCQTVADTEPHVTFEARTLPWDRPVRALRNEETELPVVVTKQIDGKTELVGILTAFDLL